MPTTRRAAWQDPEDWGSQPLRGGSSDSEDLKGGTGKGGGGDFRPLLAALPGITEEAPFELRVLEVGPSDVVSDDPEALLRPWSSSNTHDHCEPCAGACGTVKDTHHE